MTPFGIMAKCVGKFYYLFLALSFFITPVLFTSALYEFQRKEKWNSLLQPTHIWINIYTTWPKWIFSAIIYTGIMIIGRPIYGFSFFIGFLLIIAYTNVIFSNNQ